MKVPIAKPYLDELEAQAAYDTILSGWVTQGPRVEEFEEKFAKYVGSKYAVAVSNCTTALHLSMVVAGIGEGDEVICPSMSYIATANSIKHCGAAPVFAEVQPINYNLVPDHTESLITEKTKAIMLVHQLGMPADIDAFRAICNKHNILLIEDAACAIGSSYYENKIGSHSDYVCFSFHPRKVLTTGDGGMITTSNKAIHDKLKLLRQHGMSVNDRVRHNSDKVIFEEHVAVGYNYRMTDIQASVGIKQLEKLDTIVKERRKIAIRYHEAFSNIDWIELPIEPDSCISNYQSYCIQLKDNSPISRNDLMQRLLDIGISTRRAVMNSHREPAYEAFFPTLSLPISEKLMDNGIIIPLYFPMPEAEIAYVIENVKRYLSN
jgi:perosamine synthetase